MKNYKKLLVIFLIGNSVLIHCMDSNPEAEDEFTACSYQWSPSKIKGHELFNHFIEPAGAFEAFYVTCPYNKYTALLRPAQNNIRPQLVVLTADGKVYARQFLDFKKTIALALAANPNIFATIYQKTDPQFPSDTMEILQIQRVDTKQIIKEMQLTKGFKIPSACNHPVMAFNQQGTELILWELL